MPVVFFSTPVRAVHTPINFGTYYCRMTEILLLPHHPLSPPPNPPDFQGQAVDTGTADLPQRETDMVLNEGIINT